MPTAPLDRDALARAYQATSYFVDGPEGRFTIRVGTVSPEADALAKACGVDCWAYVTAYNPGSVPAPREHNEARQRELGRAASEAGYRFFGGEGAADDGAWPPEPSLLVLGIGEEEAATLGRRFGQAAVVVSRKGEPARLIWAD